MIGSDKWFKWCFNIFIFLMCVQLGMFLFLKSIFYQAEKRMEDNSAKITFACGDHNTDKAYWPIPKSVINSEIFCKNKENCPDSLWMNPQQEDHKLHVISVVKPRPSILVDGQVEPGHFVDLKLQSFKNPTTLVLVSQSMMQWNFDFIPPEFSNLAVPEIKSFDGPIAPNNFDLVVEEKSTLPEEWKKVSMENLKEVIVVGAKLVWIEGLPKDTKITYFSKEQLCAYPIAWEELSNSENEFRRLALALKEYTDLNISTFQGKEVGRSFKVPFTEIPDLDPLEKTRGLSSAESESSDSPLFSNGIHWKRSGKSLLADHYQLSQDGVVKHFPLPEKTMQAHYEKGSDKLFVIRNFHFGTWNKKEKAFEAIRPPLSLPALRWPTAMTFNPYRSELFIYNDERGGEIFTYNVVTSKWKVFAKKVGYSLVGLHFNKESKSLWGPRFQGHQISEILKFSQDGKIMKSHRLVQPLDFTKNKWRAQLVQNNNDLWIKVSHPAEPSGELYPLNPDGQKL